MGVCMAVLTSSHVDMLSRLPFLDDEVTFPDRLLVHTLNNLADLCGVQVLEEVILQDCIPDLLLRSARTQNRKSRSQWARCLRQAVTGLNVPSLNGARSAGDERTPS